MKKLLKILLSVLILLIVGVLAYTYFGYNSWSPGEVAGIPDQNSIKYYHSTYDECRSSFRKSALELKSKLDSVEVFPIQVKSKSDDDLTIDVCYIPAQQRKSRLLILSSGIHGIEGYVGSAVQQMLMEEFINQEMVSETGVLFIHALNPYGFKNTRRVTENNIDLNRNCDVDSSLFSTENRGYSQLYSMLNPSGKANAGSLLNQFFMLVALEKLATESMKTLRQAILQGQYKYAEGLYFGGKRSESQVTSIAPLLIKYARDYEKILNIDLHTGYGELGVLHLFPNPVSDAKVKSAIEQVFAGYKVDWGDSDDFYSVNGSFSDFIGKLLPGKMYMPMTFEYGTLSSQTTLGSIHSLHNMILENQGFHYGYQSGKTKERIQKYFREMYYPSSILWRSKVIADTRKVMESSFGNFRRL